MNLDKELERLKQLMDKGKGLKLDEITKLLGWSLKNKKENREILEKWIEDGDLMRNNRGKYNIPENLGFVKGTFSIIKDRFAFVDTAEEGIFIPKPHFNSALDGDTVLVKITSGLNGDKKKEGEVVEVISRERDTIVGILQRNENFGFVTPTHSFGKDIYIPYRMMKDAKNQQLVVVKITSWGTNEKKPEGEIIEVIGDPYNTNNMIEALIVREGMSETFSKPVLAEARSIATTIPKDEIAKEKI